jgi:hypothetical protein
MPVKITSTVNREEYERELRRRQEEHLKKVNSGGHAWQPCAHDNCNECHGTGVKVDGSRCVHMISCPCPKCSPQYLHSISKTSP